MTATRVRSITKAKRRRRRPQLRKISRAFTFGPALVLPVWGWAQLHEPAHWAGLAVMTALGLFIIPATIVLVLFAPGGRMALIPRKARTRYRNRDNHWYWHNDGRGSARSSQIGAFLRRVVWSADRFQCVVCRHLPAEQRHDLEGDIAVDHWCPWILGGLTVLGNLVTLCRYHNTIKSYYWRDRDGYEHYRSRDERAIAQARQIAVIERGARRNPFRWLRAAWALGG